MNYPPVHIYTDGACSGNPGPGGWGTILVFQGKEKELWGCEDETTNNRMELKAAIEGLKALKFPCRVRLYSDSSYLVNAFNNGWLKNGRLTVGGPRTGNRSKTRTSGRNCLLWPARHQIEWIKVKGHADNEYNNRCDKLAVKAYRK